MKTTSLLLVVLLAGFTLAVAADAPFDPAAQYLDAFLLIQDGDAAAQQANWPAAHGKFTDAHKLLNAIKEQAATWQPQMVDFRIKYCADQLDAITPKLPPKPPTLSAAIVAPVAPPKPPPVETTPPKTPEPTPVPMPAAVAAATTDTAEAKELRAQLIAAKAQIADIRRDMDALNRQNKELSAQLASAKSTPVTVVPTPRTDDRLQLEYQTLTAEVNKLRWELADARERAAKPAKTSPETESLRQQNRQLSDQVASLQQQLATASRPVPAPSDSTEVRRLRTELADAKAEIARAKRETAKLSSAPVAARPAGDPAELQKLRAEADAAKAAAERAAALQKQNDALAKKNLALAKQNADLEKQLAAKPVTSTPTGNRGYMFRRDETAVAKADSTEAQHLRAELKTAQSDADKARRANAERIEELTKQNRELAAKLAAAQKPAPVVVAAAPADPAEIRRLKADLEQAKADAERAKRDAAKLAAAPKPAPVVIDRSSEVNKLRADLTAANAESERAKKTAAANMADLQKQIASLRTELAAAQNKPAPVAKEPADVRKMRAELTEVQAATAKNAEMMQRLREENSFLRNLLDTYAARSPELRGQLRKFTPTPKELPPQQP